MLQWIFEIVFQLVARAVGVTIVATVTCIASGFRKSYIEEWKRLFVSPTAASMLIDLLGLAVIVAVPVVIALAIYLAVVLVI
jgi:hypothetical protein